MTFARGRTAAWLFAALLLTPIFMTADASAQTNAPCPVLAAQSTAEYVTSGVYGGNYRYTISLTWDLGRRDPTHLDILVGLRDCACVCDPRLFYFTTPAGTCNGVNLAGPCVVSYVAEYKCMGDPTIKATTPGAAIRLHALEDGCNNDGSGSGTFVFYSPLPPGGQETYLDAIALKQGTDTCYGALVGVLPMCDCSVPAGPTTWGKLKGYYH
jgi:hypothetical protein